MMRKGAFFVLVMLSFICSAASAQASDPIEGTWSFNGGEVAVTEAGNGTFRGVVVKPTKFSECEHPVGEEVWTQIQPQADGSYWGLHQWYFEGSCAPNPERGPTAWRVLTAEDGSRSLEVCFSEPGKSQPKIPASGKATGATFGCSSSARTGGVTQVTQAEAPQYILLPGNGLCLSRAKLKIRLRDPKGDPIVKAKVRLRSGKIRRRAKLIDKSNGFVALLNLRGLTKSKFTVSVDVTTALGNHLKRKRTYRRCGPTRVGKHHHKHHA